MASPVRRRVLGLLDANTSMSTPAPLQAVKPAAAAVGEDQEKHFPLSPPASIETKKRPLTEDSAAIGEEAAASTLSSATPSKKMCLSEQQRPKPPATVEAAATTSRPSLSPATSSVFDLSVMVNASQSTNITEPDAEAAPLRTNASSGIATREQSRQRAEILKLRLGLAQYKLRTGQVDVPLEQLRVVPAAAQRRFEQYQQQMQQRQQLQELAGRAQSKSRTPLPVSPRRRESSAGEWVRQQQRQQQQESQHRHQYKRRYEKAVTAAPQPRQQAPLPQRWTQWGPASSSGRASSVPSATVNVAESRGRDLEAERERRNDDESLPQQPRPQLDAVDAIEDSDLSDNQDASRRKSGSSGLEKDNDQKDEDADSLLPQLPRIRQLSPKKNPSNGTSTGAATTTTTTTTNRSLLTTPRGKRLLVESHDGGDGNDISNNSHFDGLTSSAMRGSAVNGLLSLARS